jgi:hypothetical protein
VQCLNLSNPVGVAGWGIQQAAAMQLDFFYGYITTNRSPLRGLDILKDLGFGLNSKR